MSLKDYSDEDDYYTQGFEKEGVVSIWVGLKDNANDPEELDALQDLCGVGYYDLDNQEANCFDFNLVTLQELLEEISYSKSFMEDVLDRAKEKGLSEARWVIVQYDFEYNPRKVKRKVSDDPVFLGCFSYVAE
ncbi:MAG: immunity 22 family protein [Pseudomonadota bacterium]|uniref:immunity 22 family protein n=1 Tax=Gallaecimonas pentaromativorans TaxID=584787 RepID=UPI00067F0039|nr:immunity 22 family protein [Gallaecimonas pentaromativorans]MED5526275.1 immunity 22 family protein [Pseudomonadota bacterium]